MSYGRFVDGRVIQRRMDEKDARMQRATQVRAALVKSCANCEHFDGDVFCSLPTPVKLIHGCIKEPALVSCANHEAKGRG